MRHRLTEYEKIMIIKNKDSKSFRKLARELGIAHHMTIFKFYQRWLKRKAITNKKQTGRPKGLSNRALQRLKNILTKQPLLSLKKIKEKLNLGVHVRTLSNYARKIGFKSYKQAIRPLITPRQRALRVDWANKYSHWTHRNWSKVLWTDESSFEFNYQYSKRIWRKRGDRYKAGYYEARKQKFGKTYVKVWGCFSSTGLGDLVFVEDYCSGEERWGKKVYKRILEENLEKNGRALIGSNFILQDDGDTSHKSKLVEDWKKSHKIESLSWPPASCDISKI